MKKVRRVHAPEFKAEVAIAAVQAGGATQRLSRDFGVHRNLIRQWRDELVERAEQIFLERMIAVGEDPPGPPAREDAHD